MGPRSSDLWWSSTYERKGWCNVANLLSLNATMAGHRTNAGTVVTWVNRAVPLDGIRLTFCSARSKPEAVAFTEEMVQRFNAFPASMKALEAANRFLTHDGYDLPGAGAVRSIVRAALRGEEAVSRG